MPHQRRSYGFTLISFLSLIAFPSMSLAQSLALSSAAVSTSGTATLSLTLTLPASSTAPSALQWTLQYPTAAITNVQVTAGTSATGAGKNFSCFAVPGAYTCVLSGPNQKILAQGILATVKFTLASTSANVAIGLTNLIGVSAAGAALSVTGAGGMISAAGTPPTTAKLKTLACIPLSLTSGNSGTCTITLTSVATSSVPVTIAANLAVLTVPPSVTVPTGAVSAQFTVAAGTTTTTQSAAVTATLNGASVVANLSITPAVTSYLRINSGGQAYTDPSSGQVWSADTGFSGGLAYAVPPTSPAPTLYQSGRTGNFSYSLNVPNGFYTVVLKFAEPNFTQPGQRAFNVMINGNAALNDFDVFAQAGRENVAVDRSFPVSVSAGQILIQFATGRAGTPLVNAIEILNGTATASTPPTTGTTRVNVAGSALTDVSGIDWSADTGFAGGKLSATAAAIANTSVPTVYRDARTGTFNYTFVLPNGTYTVILKFAELQYTSSGKRVFNVFINGTAALSNFDVFAAAGGALTAIDKSFSVNVANGSIILSFTPGAVGPPMLNGIEIIPQI